MAATLLLPSVAATAADFYVEDGDFGVEGSSYPAGWFVGDGSAGHATSTPDGLAVDGSDGLFQLLNGTTPSTGLTTLGASAELSLASGFAVFQIPVFTTGTAGFTTLYADLDGMRDDVWYSSQDFGGFTGKVDTATLQEFEDAMDPDYEILAFGFYVADGYEAVVASITWAGNTHYFTPPVPEPTPGPTPTAPPTLAPEPEPEPDVVLPPTEGKGGTTHTVTIPDGTFDPFEDVFVTWYSTPVFGGWYQANVNGGLSITVSVPSSLGAGTHTFQLTGNTSGVTAGGSFTVLALANSGADAAPLIVLGGVLLLAGVGFGASAVALRRKKAIRLQ